MPWKVLWRKDGGPTHEARSSFITAEEAERWAYAFLTPDDGVFEIREDLPPVPFKHFNEGVKIERPEMVGLEHLEPGQQVGYRMKVPTGPAFQEGWMKHRAIEPGATRIVDGKPWVRVPVKDEPVCGHCGTPWLVCMAIWEDQRCCCPDCDCGQDKNFVFRDCTIKP